MRLRIQQNIAYPDPKHCLEYTPELICVDKKLFNFAQNTNCYAINKHILFNL